MELAPDAIRKAFLPPEKKITCDVIQDLFVPMFFPTGSNK
jgi:hypothetical protein